MNLNENKNIDDGLRDQKISETWSEDEQSSPYDEDLEEYVDNLENFSRDKYFALTH